MSKFFALQLFGLILFSSCSQLWAEEDGDTPHVSVTGTAVTRVTPDTIRWSITTTDEDPDLSKAKQASDVAARRVMTLKDELQLESDQLTSGRLQIKKIYNYDRNRNRTSFKHFKVTRQFSLKQNDLERFDAFLTRIVGGPVEASFVFETSNIYDLRNETRIKAVQLARKKAEAMAKALGVEIGKPIKIAEVKMSGPQVTMFNGAFQAPSGNAADGSSGLMVPDAIEVVISIDVTFELK